MVSCRHIHKQTIKWVASRGKLLLRVVRSTVLDLKIFYLQHRNWIALLPKTTLHLSIEPPRCRQFGRLLSIEVSLKTPASVTKCLLIICSIFGHLQLWKCSQLRKQIAKGGLIFCRTLNKLLQKCPIVPTVNLVLGYHFEKITLLVVGWNWLAVSHTFNLRPARFLNYTHQSSYMI